MNNITKDFNQIYLPKKALLIYHSVEKAQDVYVESYDMDENGRPVNAHPLSDTECHDLSLCFKAKEQLQYHFLQPKGLMPETVLYLKNSFDGFALWYTPAQKIQLYFKDTLNIPSGKAHLPALLWKADREKLSLYAIRHKQKPDIKTTLFHAPFFNIYADGSVCMGTVDIDIAANCRLEDFIEGWQNYFFDSYFSHMMDGHVPLHGNLVQLWQELTTTDKAFPNEVLKKHSTTIQDLLK